MSAVVAIGFVAVLAGVGLGTLVADRFWAIRQRRRIAGAPAHPQVRSAFDELIAAQTRFAAAVQRYEVALERSAVVSGPRTGDGIQVGVPPRHREIDEDELARLDAAKDEPRHRLMAAKAAWERARPGPIGALDHAHWIGFGEVRTWGAGPIGGERAFLRFEHASDPRAWVVFEVARTRFGLGVGAEYQRVGAMALHATPSVLLALLRGSMAHTDLVLRPGFGPFRALRHRRRPAAVRSLLGGLQSQADVEYLRAGSPDDTADERRRDVVLTAASRDGDDEATLEFGITGPACALGLWLRWAAPSLRVLAASGHEDWNQL